MSNLKELQVIAKDFSILYVEDNDALREKASRLLKKFFDEIDLAEDGSVGLELFKKKHHSIVLSDIKMPNMDGMTLAMHIKKIAPESKIIIMSAFDDKELLLEGIKLGVFRFLKKPVNVTELSEVLYETIVAIKHEQNMRVFYSHLKNVFDYQSSMVIMLHGSKIVLANDMFLEFFNYESLDECKKSMPDISEKFLEHDGFLYNHDDINSMQSIKSNPTKLYHIKLSDKERQIKHFILKYKNIPEKDNCGVLSFDDITELNLLKLFDKNQSLKDEKLIDSKAMFDLLGVMQRNSAKIELHNYYKGLSITNDGIIVDIKNKVLTIKTTYMQQKAVQLEKKLILVSNSLPHAIECSEVQSISFEKQIIELKSLRFIKTSPITRTTIRVKPAGKQTVSLFIGQHKFHGDVEIDDISLNSVKLKLNALPAGLDEDSKIVLDFVLELDKKPLIINTKAKMFRKHESNDSFYIVFIFENMNHSGLIKYITKRQMALIREIKGMQNG